MKGPTADADAEQERGAGVCSAQGKHGGRNKSIFTRERKASESVLRSPGADKGEGKTTRGPIPDRTIMRHCCPTVAPVAQVFPVFTYRGLFCSPRTTADWETEFV